MEERRSSANIRIHCLLPGRSPGISKTPYGSKGSCIKGLAIKLGLEHIPKGVPFSIFEYSSSASRYLKTGLKRTEIVGALLSSSSNLLLLQLA